MALRWAFRFSLRTLVLVVIPLAAVLSFLGSRWRYWEFERQMARIDAHVSGWPASLWTLQRVDNNGREWQQLYWHSIDMIRSFEHGDDVTALRVPDWPRLVNLQEVEDHTHEFGDKEMLYIGRCRKLTSLRLDQSHMTGAGLSQLANLPLLTKLTLRQRLTGDDIKRLPANLKLKELELELTGDGLDALMGNDAVRDVEGLTIHLLDNHAKPESFARLQDCRYLRNLYIHGPMTCEQVAALAKGRHCLPTITLVGATVTSEEMAHFARKEWLKRLSLRTCNLTDADIAPLAQSPQLEWLDLENNWVTSQGVLPFATSNLKVLTLKSTRVDDSLLEFVRENKGKTLLFLDDTLITAKGMKAIAEFMPEGWPDYEK